MFTIASGFIRKPKGGGRQGLYPLLNFKKGKDRNTMLFLCTFQFLKCFGINWIASYASKPFFTYFLNFKSKELRHCMQVAKILELKLEFAKSLGLYPLKEV